MEYIFQLSYLCYVDRIALAQTCKEYHKYNEIWGESFKNIVKRKLRNHLSNPEKFLKLMQNGEIVISGSFILACLFDEDWYGDIDIYENSKYAQDRINDANKLITLNSRHYTDQFIRDIAEFEGPGKIPDSIRELQFTPMTIFLFDQSEKYITANMKFSKERIIGNNIREFTIGNIKFQHIPLSFNPHKLIKSTFDADLLKNTFDGTTLRVTSWDLIRSRKDVIKPTGMLFHEYCMWNDDSEHDKNRHIEILHELSNKRIRKYAERGFYFEKHEYYDAMANYLTSKMVCNRTGLPDHYHPINRKLSKLVENNEYQIFP